MSKKIQIPAAFIRGAMVCVAPDFEVRPFLKGVAFDPVRGEIIGSDGHLLYAAQFSELSGALDDVRVLKIPQKIPTKAETVTLDFETNEMTIDNTGVRLDCEQINAVYPAGVGEIIDDDGDTTASDTSIAPFGVSAALVRRVLLALPVPKGSGHVWHDRGDAGIAVRPMRHANEMDNQKVIVMKLMEGGSK